MAVVIAVDAGTTGVRSLAVDPTGAVVDIAYRELTQHYPRPGWVEHDAAEIWSTVVATLTEVAQRQASAGETVAAIGVTNQRETVVAWDRRTGEPLAPAIVWQDRRTADYCARLRAAGHQPVVRATTGLVLDPYFSATKIHWLLTDGGLTVTPDLAFGTVDAWLIWNLTGGAGGGAFVTDVTNASRTLLFDIRARAWSDEMCALFEAPSSALPDVVPSCGRLGPLTGDHAPSGSALHGVPVSGVAGDQQAALFGQACVDPGMAKVTYGTGSFVLMHAGAACPPPDDKVLTTVAWDLGQAVDDDPVAYAYEGAVFVTGAAVQWLRDGLGVITRADEVGPLAASVADSEGVYVVPAFAGLGSPWWDPTARGVVTGLTRGLGRAHIARAVVEAMALQVRDVVDAMAAASGRAIDVLRVDGGASVMDLLLQIQADQLQAPVARPTATETTALGAATLAGLAEGVWGSLEDLRALWRLDRRFEPVATKVAADRLHDGWTRAVERSLAWA